MYFNGVNHTLETDDLDQLRELRIETDAATGEQRVHLVFSLVPGGKVYAPGEAPQALHVTNGVLPRTLNPTDAAPSHTVINATPGTTAPVLTAPATTATGDPLPASAQPVQPVGPSFSAPSATSTSNATGDIAPVTAPAPADAPTDAPVIEPVPAEQAPAPDAAPAIELVPAEQAPAAPTDAAAPAADPAAAPSA